MQTIAQFIKDNSISMTSKRADNNPHIDSDIPMNHWSVTLKMGGKRYTLKFSQGMGIKHDPTIEGVLDCLASDAVGFDNARNLDDFASDYGYTSTSKAVKVYKSVQHEARRLREFLGDELYDRLLWEVDRE